MAKTRSGVSPEDHNAPLARPARWLTFVVVLTLGVHLWPMRGVRLWDMLVPWNAALVLWTLLLLGWSAARLSLAWLRNLPHAGICAYAALAAISAATAPDLARAFAFALKVALSLLAMHVIVISAVRGDDDIRRIFRCVALTAAGSVCACLLERWVIGTDGFGFFRSGLKYGTFVGMVVPLALGGLLGESSRAWRACGWLLLIGAFGSVGTVGGLAALIAGLLVLLVKPPRRRGRAALAVVGAIALAAAGLALPANRSLQSDSALVEPTGDCAQRYIEWQAFVNLVGARPAAGTGVGNINEYRSEYYSPLPKLNTIAPFDQNLWLGTAAEIGWLGLVVLIWGLLGHGRISLQLMRSGDAAASRAGSACLAALAGACAGSLFCSATYHGLLAALGLVLALSSAAFRIHPCSETN